MPERGVLITQAAEAAWARWFGDTEPWAEERADVQADWCAAIEAALDVVEALIRADERTQAQARLVAEFAVERALARQGVPQHPKDAAYVNALLEAGGRASAAIGGRMAGEATP